MDDMEREELDMETEDPAEIDARSEQEMAEKQMQDTQDAMDMEEDAINDDEFDLPEMNESALIPIGRIRKSGKLLEESLFKSLQINIASKMLKENALSESGKVDINMDLVLAETLSYYTLLETLYTSRIINFQPSEVRSLAKELVFRSTCDEKK